MVPLSCRDARTMLETRQPRLSWRYLHATPSQLHRQPSSELHTHVVCSPDHSGRSGFSPSIPESERAARSSLSTVYSKIGSSTAVLSGTAPPDAAHLGFEGDDDGWPSPPSGAARWLSSCPSSDLAAGA